MKLYIGGISPEVMENDLLELYSQFGKVTKVDLLKDPETGVNRGYAFIEMDADDNGEGAILGTHNTLLGGNNIQVSLSRSRLDQKIERQKKTREPRKPRENNDFKNTGFKRENRPFRDKNAPKPEGNFNRGENRNNTRTPNQRFPRSNNSNYNNGNNSASNSANNRPPVNRFSRNNDNGNNRYNNDYTSNNSIRKGVDYGRNGNSRPQTSFLGQEGFANSTRTMDPVYNSNNNNRRSNNSGSNYGKKTYAPRNNYNNNNKPKDPVNNPESSNSLYKPNTSDILGNLENI